MESENLYGNTDSAAPGDNVQNVDSHENTDRNTQETGNTQQHTEQQSTSDDVNKRGSHTDEQNEGGQDKNQQTEGGVSTKGVAGVMESNFGSDKTTTSTFEKSQGEKYGEKFDETGAQIKGKFSVSEQGSGSDAQATGSGAGGKQDSKSGHDTDTNKEGFGQKIKHKAEGMFHGHHDSKNTESRTDAH